MNSGNHKKRIFTREEDELILANSKGEISQSTLMHTLHCGFETVQRRAAELGLELKRQVYSPRSGGLRPPKPKRNLFIDEPLAGFQEVPHVGEDRLLQRLHLHCGNRRYESLVMKE